MEAHQKNTNTEKEFCHPGNLDAAVAYLSRELTLVGLLAVTVPGSQGQLDAVALVNAAWRLLRSARDGLTQQQELQIKLGCADTDKQKLEVGQVTSSPHIITTH